MLIKTINYAQLFNRFCYVNLAEIIGKVFFCQKKRSLPVSDTVVHAYQYDELCIIKEGDAELRKQVPVIFSTIQ